jgi:nucleoid DNA-binding protein
VTVSGVGSFRAVARRGRRILHPATGREIVLPPQRRTHFVPGKRLRDAVGSL